MLRAVALGLLMAAISLGCSGKNAGPTPTGGGGGDGVQPSAACDALRESVVKLYTAAIADPVDGEIEDAAHIIMTDCRRDPARFVPCIRGATTVAQLERDCVIPLDEEGTVEAKQFAGD